MEAIPGLLSLIPETFQAVGSVLGPVAGVLGPLGTAVGAVENMIGGGKSAAAPTQAAPTAPTPAQPTTSPTDFKNNESAYWNQLLAGTGISPTGQLPDSIQQNIDRQASLLG